MILPHDPPVHNPESLRIAIESPRVDVVALHLLERYTVRALATVRIGDIVINGVCIVYHRGRLCVRMPQTPTPASHWTPVIELVTPGMKAAVNDAVLEEYKRASTCKGLA